MPLPSIRPRAAVRSPRARRSRPRRRRRSRRAPRRRRPAAGSRCPRAPRARRPASISSVPARGLGVLQPQLEAAVAGLARPGSGCPARSPAEHRRAAPRARSPLQITVAIPAAVAISAATTFERIPPEPSGEVVWPISSSSQGAEVAHLADDPRVGVHARIGGVEAVDVGQQDQLVGRHEHRHLRGEEVVVAEGDLVGGGRVVLVDDRQHAPLEQRRERLARVQVVGARAHVEERQQHLGARHAALAQQLVVDAVELALPDRAGGLQLADASSGAAAGSITRIPRAIAPLVTTIASTPSRVQLARARRTRSRAPPCAARRRRRRRRSSRA